MVRVIFVVAAMFAASAPAAFADDLWSALQPCRSLEGSARLSCFDRVLAARDSQPVAAKPEVPPPAAKPDVPPPAATAATFGAERLAPPDDAAPQEAEFILAKVTAFGLNAFKHFTVTLDNGQVWRQLDSDTPTARLRGGETVKIARGFLDSYTLTIDDVYGSYRVKRIK